MTDIGAKYFDQKPKTKKSKPITEPQSGLPKIEGSH